MSEILKCTKDCVMSRQEGFDRERCFLVRIFGSSIARQETFFALLNLDCWEDVCALEFTFNSDLICTMKRTLSERYRFGAGGPMVIWKKKIPQCTTEIPLTQRGWERISFEEVMDSMTDDLKGKFLFHLDLFV